MVSFAIALGVVVLHLNPIGTIFFVGTKLEGIVIMTMIGLWAALVVTISDSHNGLAVDENGAVAFGNLYYFGWAGFGCGVALGLNFLRTVYYLDVTEEMNVRADRLNLWVSNLVVGLVMIASAANVFDYVCNGDTLGTKFCNRSLLALLVGMTGAAVSIVVVGMKIANSWETSFGVEFGFSTFLFLVNSFSLSLVTSEDGPGAKLGNLYYFSWLSLLLPFFLMFSCYQSLSAGSEGSHDGMSSSQNASKYRDSENNHSSAWIQPSAGRHTPDLPLDPNHPSRYTPSPAPVHPTQHTSSYYESVHPGDDPIVDDQASMHQGSVYDLRKQGGYPTKAQDYPVKPAMQGGSYV